MPSKASVTHWIGQFNGGDRDAAARALWERYFVKLVRFARKKLEDLPRPVADEELVALSAFKSFCLAAERGRFPNLADRNELWRLLLWITASKAKDLRRYIKGRPVQAPDAHDFDRLIAASRTVTVFALGVGVPRDDACFSTVSGFWSGMNHLEKRCGWLWFRSGIVRGTGWRS